jgi:hypothetical protein
VGSVSPYPQLSGQELEQKYAEFSAKYGAALHDYTRPRAERRLAILVSAQVKQADRKQEIREVQEFVKQHICSQFTEWAMLICVTLEKCKDYGLMGEQRVLISFIRNILHIPHDRAVTQFDADKMHRLMEECDARHGKKQGNEYLDDINSYTLDLFGMKYHNYDLPDLNDLFDLLGADYYVFSKSDPYGCKFIFGQKENLEIDGNTATVLRREFIRSPQFILGIAAEVNDDTTVIRRESCDVIFFNKPQQFFSQSKAEMKHAMRHPNSAIREMLKKQILFWYNAATTEDVLKIKEAYIRDMIENIIFHENGHFVSFQDMEPLHFAFHNTLASGEHAGAVLLEALADWAPVRGRRKGAFLRFVEIAKTDPRRAAAMVFAYMSDAWFVDEIDEFMGLMSDILVALPLSFIRPGITVDFEGIEREQPVIYALFLNRYTTLTEKLLCVIQEARYLLPADNGGLYEAAYGTLEQEVHKMYRNSVNCRSLEELRLFKPFWVNITGYLKKYSPSGWRQYQEVLAEEAVGLEQAVLDLVIRNMQKGA